MSTPSSYANQDDRRLSTRILASRAAMLDSFTKKIESGALVLVPGNGSPDSIVGDTFGGRGYPTPAAANPPLRNASPIEPGPPRIEGLSAEEQDIADVEYAERECWQNINWVKFNVKKPSAMAIANLMTAILNCKEKKIRLRDQLYKKKAAGIPGQWEALKGVLLGALEKHPEARKDVVEALAQFFGQGE